MDAIATGVRKQWNFANSLTAFRACSVIPAIGLVLLGDYVLPYVDIRADSVLFVLILLAVVSDAEGYWARATGTTTNLGRVFDPLADKVLVNVLFAAYVFSYGDFWAAGLLACNLAYDVDNTQRRIGDIVAAVYDQVSPADSAPTTWFSKTKTCVLYGLVIIYHAPVSWGVIHSEGMLATLAVLATVFVLLTWGYNRRDLLARLAL